MLAERHPPPARRLAVLDEAQRAVAAVIGQRIGVELVEPRGEQAARLLEHAGGHPGRAGFDRVPAQRLDPLRRLVEIAPVAERGLDRLARRRLAAAQQIGQRDRLAVDMVDHRMRHPLRLDRAALDRIAPAVIPGPHLQIVDPEQPPGRDDHDALGVAEITGIEPDRLERIVDGDFISVAHRARSMALPWRGSADDGLPRWPT